MSEPLQIWVRNDKGKVWGPLMPATLELLFDNALIAGKVQLSLDGSNYVYPARMPEVRDAVPKALWGDATGPAIISEQGQAPTAPAPGGRPAAPRSPGGPPTLGRPGAAPGRPPSLAPGPPSLAPAGPPPSLTPVEAERVADVEPPAPSKEPARPTAPVAGPGAAAAAAARAAAAASAPPVRAADRRPLAPNLGAEVAPPPPAPEAAAPYSLPSTEIPAKGSLQTDSSLRLYYLAASSDATGLLTLTLADRTVQVHFRKGNPEFVDSTHAEDQLPTFLVKNQLVTFEQLGKAEKEKAKFGGELVGALFGLGLLNPGTAFQHLAQRASAILVRGLFAEHGTFTWEVKDLPSHKAMPLGNRWSVLSEQVRKLPGAELRRRLTAAIDLPVMKSGGQVAAADLRLSPHETRALGYFDGVRSLNQLLHDIPNDADHILRVAFLLKELEAVSFASVKVAAPPPVAPSKAAAPAAGSPPSSAPRVAPAVAAKPSAPAARPGPPKITAPSAPAAPRPAAPVVAVDFDAEIKTLTALFEKMKTQNHFEVLGLNNNADGAGVKAAYFKFARAYHPDTVPPNAPPALGKLKEDIFGRVGEANRTLSDDKLRAEYLEEVKAGNAGEKVDIAMILAAEELFQKGTILVKAKKFPEAVKFFDDAIKNADEAEYYAWRGYAKFFTFPDKRVGHAEALKDLSVCLKRNANIVAAWYFHGHMAKLVGDLPAAKKHFQKTLQLNPEHLDAQRELRMMK